MPTAPDGWHRARWNIAPTQPVLVGTAEGWAWNPWGVRLGDRLVINARSETAFERFGRGIAHRRCLVPADGFYEWAHLGRRRLPFRFHPPGGALWTFGGILHRDKRGDALLVLTTTAHSSVAPYHDRTPVIVPGEDRARWLDPAIHAPAQLEDVLLPRAEAHMQRTPVSTAVNRVATDDPSCHAQRLDEPVAQMGFRF